MTKSELIKRLARKYKGLYQKDIDTVVDVIFNEISSALSRNERVELRGFGAFSIRTRKPRKARNPRTNEVVYLEERNSPYFRCGKGLRERINKEA
jgi:integration host factor subunit beta